MPDTSLSTSQLPLPDSRRPLFLESAPGACLVVTAPARIGSASGFVRAPFSLALRSPPEVMWSCTDNSSVVNIARCPPGAVLLYLTELQRAFAAGEGAVDNETRTRPHVSQPTLTYIAETRGGGAAASR